MSKDAMSRFDALCFQLVQQSYTKSELLVIMRLLESSIAKHGRKIYFDWTN